MAAAVDFMQPVFLMCLQSLCNVAEANQQKWLKGKVKPWPPLLSVSQDTSRRYENKAGAFITGIDVNSKVNLQSVAGCRLLL